MKLVCVFEKLSTNQRPRVRSWPCRLHESEIRGQGNQRFFSLSSSLLRLVVAALRLARWSLSPRKIKKNLWDQGIQKHDKLRELVSISELDLFVNRDVRGLYENSSDCYIHMYEEESHK